MSWDGIIAGDYGQVCQLTVNDIDTNAAANISGYSTSQEYLLTDPGGNTATLTAAFDSDGSDGLLAYTLAEGVIDESGKWVVRAKVTSGSAVLTSKKHKFDVLD